MSVKMGSKIRGTLNLEQFVNENIKIKKNTVNDKRFTPAIIWYILILINTAAAWSGEGK